MNWAEDALQRVKRQNKPTTIDKPSGGWAHDILASIHAQREPNRPPDFDSRTEMDAIDSIIPDMERIAVEEDLTELEYKHRNRFKWANQERYSDPDQMDTAWNMQLQELRKTRENRSGIDKALTKIGGMVGFDEDDGLSDLSPEDQFKANVSNIMRTVDDPAEREAQIRTERLKIRKKLFDDKIAPVQAYYTQKLIQDHDEEKQGSRIAEWIDAWDRGVAGIASTATGLVGAKEWARAYHLARFDFKLAPSLDQDWLDKVINITGETAPLMVVSTAASIATGGAASAMGASGSAVGLFGALGGGAVSFGVEGNDAYHTALDHGIDEQRARIIGLQVGFINAVIESIGGSGTKFFKRSVKRNFLNKMKQAGKWTVDRMKTAVAEALEEAGQEASSIVGETRYRKLNGKEIVDRVTTAAAGGFLLGGAMDISLGAVSRMGAQRAADDAEKKWGTNARRSISQDTPGSRAPSATQSVRQDGAKVTTVSESGLTHTVEFKNEVEATKFAGKQRAKMEAKKAVKDIKDPLKGKPAPEDFAEQMGSRENKPEDIQPEMVSKTYDELQDLAKEGDLSSIQSLWNEEFVGGKNEKLATPNTDEGTLAVAGIMRKLGSPNDYQISMSEKVRTLADQIKDGYETKESARQALIDGGLDPNLSPAEVEIRGRNFRDKMNRVIIELHNGHDAGTLLHETAEAFYRGVWGDEFSNKVIGLRSEYENKTGDVREGSDQEWLSDMAVEYAVHNKIHERAGISIRRMFNKYRQVFRRLLARAINLRKNIAAGNVSPELQKVLENPFAGRGDTNPSIQVDAQQTYKLSGPEDKLKSEVRATDEIAEAQKAFILSDGSAIAFTARELHEDYAKKAGVSIGQLLKAGSVRLTAHASEQLGIESYDIPNEIQQMRINQWVNAHLQNTGKEVIVMYEDAKNNSASSFIESRKDMSAFWKQADPAFLQTTGYKLERADDAKPSYGQFVEGHVLPERLKMSEDERKQLMISTTGKDSMSNMTHGDAKKFIQVLQAQAKKKGIKLNTMSTAADTLAGIIEDHNELDQVRKNGLEQRGLRALWMSAKRNVHWYLYNQTRIERLIHALNGHEHGALYNQLWMDPKEANEMATINAQDIAMGLQKFVLNFGRDKQRAIFSRKKQEIFTRPNDDRNPIHRGSLTASERMSIYMLIQNENGKRHLIGGNGYTETEIAQVLQWMRKQPDQMEIKIADYMMGVYEKQFPAFAASHKIATGKELTKEDAYSPLYINDVDFTDHRDYLNDLLNLKDYSIAQQKIGETEDRQRSAINTVKLNAFDNFLYNTERVARYTAMAPTIVRVGKILNNKRFKRTLNSATDGYGSEILQKWLKDTARGYAADSREVMSRITRWYRKNSMVYVLGYKIPSALRQTLSAFNAAAKDPRIAGHLLVSMLFNPPMFGYDSIRQQVYEKSNTMRTRNWDRVEGLVNRAKSAEKRLSGKTTLDEKALFMVKLLDKFTTIHAWNAAYTFAIKTMDEKTAIRYADNLIERTQPMGNAINLPAFFRGGALSQLMTTFENQINQNYNFWAHDIAGEYKAKKIGLPMLGYRILMSYILPAMIMGIMGRGDLPDEPSDFIEDLATYPIASFVLFGRWINAAIKGYGSAGTVIDVGVAEGTRMAQDLFQGDIPGTIWGAAKTASAITGKIPQQIFKTAEALMQEDGPKDIRDLIYGTRYSQGKEKEARQEGSGGRSRSRSRGRSR